MAKEKLNQLTAQSEAFQKRSVDSVLQLYLQTSSLENFNPNNSDLGQKINNLSGYIEVELSSLKNSPKVVAETTFLDRAIGNLKNAKHSFKAFHFEENDTVETVKMNSDSISHYEKGNIVYLSEEKKPEAVKEYSPIPFNSVQIPPLIPGCLATGTSSQRSCFGIKITEYLRQRINSDGYRYLNLNPGMKYCNYSFTIGADGFVKNVEVDAPHSQIKKEMRFALKNLPKMRPGLQNNEPVAVTYYGNYSFNIPEWQEVGKAQTQTKQSIAETQSTPKTNTSIEKKLTRFEILEKAAREGNAQSQYDLANMYYDGKEIPKDKNEAIYWFQRSAKNGSVNAQEDLGALYYQNKDFNNAFIWYSKAANANHSRAQYVLGYMYMKGLGVKKSRRNAKLWWKKSCALGNLDACEEVKKMNAVGNALLNTVKESVKNYTPKN